MCFLVHFPEVIIGWEEIGGSEGMQLTPFEREIIDSLVWQVEGFKCGRVKERATNRILRATLRRIEHRVIASSLEARDVSRPDRDHVVPVKTISDMLKNKDDVSAESFIAILEQFYLSVEISVSEHQRLNSLGLGRDVPRNWDGKDLFARYKEAGIPIEY